MKVSVEEKFSCEKFRVLSTTWEEPIQGTKYLVENANAVSALILCENHILQVRVFRVPIGSYLWEIPAGGIESGETPEAAAVREVFEEAGVDLSHTKLELLHVYYPLVGLASETMYMFLARLPGQLPELKPRAGDSVKEARWVLDTDFLKMPALDGKTLLAQMHVQEMGIAHVLTLITADALRK